MKFPYTEAIVLSPDDGEPLLIFRPEVRLCIYGEGEEPLAYTALVDTGADHIIFHGSVAEELGIKLQPCAGPPAETYSGGRLTLSFTDVEIQIELDDSSHRWITRIYFDASPGSKDFLILGHAGFLEFFTATFMGDELALELRANEYLPSLN